MERATEERSFYANFTFFCPQFLFFPRHRLCNQNEIVIFCAQSDWLHFIWSAFLRPPCTFDLPVKSLRNHFLFLFLSWYIHNNLKSPRHFSSEINIFRVNTLLWWTKLIRDIIWQLAIFFCSRHFAFTRLSSSFSSSSSLSFHLLSFFFSFFFFLFPVYLPVSHLFFPPRLESLPAIKESSYISCAISLLCFRTFRWPGPSQSVKKLLYDSSSILFECVPKCS